MTSVSSAEGAILGLEVAVDDAHGVDVLDGGEDGANEVCGVAKEEKQM